MNIEKREQSADAVRVGCVMARLRKVRFIRTPNRLVEIETPHSSTCFRVMMIIMCGAQSAIRLRGSPSSAPPCGAPAGFLDAAVPGLPRQVGRPTVSYRLLTDRVRANRAYCERRP